MRTLYYRFNTAADFLAHSLSNYPYGGLFVPRSRGVNEREMVMLQVTIESIMGTYCFRAGVARTDATFVDGGKRKSGMELEFIGGDKVLIDELMDDLDTDLGAFAERETERAVVPMDAILELGPDDHVSTPVLDFGPGGFFVRDVAGVLPGDTVQARLVSPEHDLDQRSIAQVMWAGSKGDEQGLGMKFVFKARSDRRRWRSLYRALVRRNRRARTAA